MRKPNLIETDRGNEFYNKIFQHFLKNIDIKPYSRKTSLGDVFEERFNETIRDLLKRPIFDKGDCSWTDVLSVITKQYRT